jgi:hypothetical protein
VRAVVLTLLACFAAAGGAAADDSTKELWPELDLWLRLSPAWRFSLFLPIASNIETDYREGNIVLQADYAWGKPGRLYTGRLLDEGRAETMRAMLLRGGYLGGKSLGDGGEAYEEKALLVEWHIRVPLTGQVLLSHRLRTDLRWLGDDREFSTRWRYRVMVEKEVADARPSLVPYGSAEAYYDSRYDTVNRVRLIGGTSLAWSPRFALEGNLTYQHDSKLSVTHLYALNVILHVYFETSRAP